MVDLKNIYKHLNQTLHAEDDYIVKYCKSSNCIIVKKNEDRVKIIFDDEGNPEISYNPENENLAEHVNEILNNILQELRDNDDDDQQQQVQQQQQQQQQQCNQTCIASSIKFCKKNGVVFKHDKCSGRRTRG